MFRSALAMAAAAALLCAAAPASAANVVFMPANDPTGMVFTTANNDGYVNGRGAVFTPTTDFNLVGVGIWQDLTGVTLSYTLKDSLDHVLRSGEAAFSTNGLEFIEFNFAELTLAAGSEYKLDFAFGGVSNQNFFYNEGGGSPFSQEGFTGIDGTQGGDTGNSVIPRLELIGEPGAGGVGAVPEPASWAMMITGFGLAGATLRRRRPVPVLAG